jgi:hypothetical protein
VRSRPVSATRVGVDASYTLGALFLAGEAAVHVQQYESLLSGVRWIGPLFLVNAIGCVVAIAGLASRRTRSFAALLGVVISAGALAALVVSYGRGLFGFREAGFRSAIVVAVITEVGAVAFLATALAGALALVGARGVRARAAGQRVEPTGRELAPGFLRPRLGMGRHVHAYRLDDGAPSDHGPGG